MNALVMYDHQTDSLWSQFLGQAVSGPLDGTKLEHLPSQLTTWGAWKQGYPQTLALDKGYSGSFDPYQSYYQSGRAGILGETRRDERLFAKEFVIGVTGAGVHRAYPFRYLNDSPVLNDTFEDRSIVVTFIPENGSSAVFFSTAGGDTLTFEQASDPMSMRDTETGSVWSKQSGEAISGPLAGGRLDQFPTFVSFWFAWKDFHPDTQLYVG